MGNTKILTVLHETGEGFGRPVRRGIRGKIISLQCMVELAAFNLVGGQCGEYDRFPIALHQIDYRFQVSQRFLLDGAKQLIDINMIIPFPGRSADQGGKTNRSPNRPCDQNGINVFIVKSVAPATPLGAIFLGVLPFWIAMLVALGILVAFPQIALFLPETMIR